MCRAGKFAIHIVAAGSGSAMRGRAFDGCACPYRLADRWGVHPSTATAAGKQILGLPLGPRHLTALSLAVEQTLGRDALRRVPLLLTVEADQAGLVARDLVERSFYGFDRRNVIILPQARRPCRPSAPLPPPTRVARPPRGGVVPTLTSCFLRVVTRSGALPSRQREGRKAGRPPPAAGRPPADSGNDARAQGAHKGYAWDARARSWVTDELSEPQCLGMGYAVKQLAWREEAFGAAAAPQAAAWRAHTLRAACVPRPAEPALASHVPPPPCALSLRSSVWRACCTHVRCRHR